MALDHVSFSQIDCMLKCARQYYFKWILKHWPPATGSMVSGSVFHSAVEANFRRKVESGLDLPLSEVLEIAAEAWTTKLARERNIDWQDASPSDLRERTMRLVTIFMERTAPFIMPRAAEEEFRVLLPGLDVTVTGRIDLITTDGTVDDYKTASKAASQDEFHQDLQTTMYAAWLLTDPTIDEVVARQHVVRDDPKTKSEYPNPQLLTSKRTRADVQWALQNQIAPCVRQIQAAIFPACTKGWWCTPKWCGNWDECKGVS